MQSMAEVPCWLFVGSKDRHGYGRKRFRGRVWSAHRVMWTLMRGEIPDGMECDHLCRVRACVNPQHLEIVTHRENMRRGHFGQKSHCPKGHPYSEANTAHYAGWRRCRTCYRAAQTAAYHRDHPEARYESRYNRAALV